MGSRIWNDMIEEGRPLWSDGSVYNLTNTMKSSLPANQTDCFSLQRNATGPGYFLTPFFCHVPLPFICHLQTPPVPATFSFDLLQVTEQHIFLQYQEEGTIELIQDKEDRSMKSEDKQGTQSLISMRKTVRVPLALSPIALSPLALSSRAVTVAGLSAGSSYSFTLKAALPTGSTWSLGQTRTAYTSESADT
ncbi:hypothetical protein EYF80_061299 [Liparis tanakae]|uniref:Uncharacterized protein n=1 Tax=Liparis tanakae TaxID=230148 RepID=A0A4Z2EIA2_9TELE|nr:hypothetical protein EYF80_061299 [Liparis tanakae]